jgi:hypothetical protein
MANIPQYLVLRAIENIVKSHGELHNTKARA